MRKLEKRAIMCLMLAALLFLGLLVFAWRYVVHGAEWSSFYGNTQVYTDGTINRGSVYDRNGVLLVECTPDGLVYNDDATLRYATSHVVGDPGGNIYDGVISRFTNELIGYDILNGTYDSSKEGKSIELTIDSRANKVAYEQLSEYDSGAIGIYNYKTGEIVCMVSTPATDPADSSDYDPESSVFFNNFIQGAVTPGSTFKLVTAAAAIDNLDMDSFSFDCDGVNEFEGEDLTCVTYHGSEDFYSVMANSCNGAFGKITRELGPETMMKYVNELGFTSEIEIDGIKTERGSFTFPEDNEIMLSWAGVGQAEDLVNPCAMMVYVGAIANGGEATVPRMIKKSNFLKSAGEKGRSLGRYLSKDTALELKLLMKNNVEKTYGAENYPGLDLYAKTGSGEIGDDINSWFVGFIDNPEYPYAFICYVKGGYGGMYTAGPIVRETLYALME